MFLNIDAVEIKEVNEYEKHELVAIISFSIFHAV